MKKVLVMMMTLLAIQLIAQTGQIDSDDKKEVKRALSYQSMIKDSLGNPIEDGKYLISFKLYDSENSNDPVWFENQNVYITDGILNVLLGNKKRLEPELFINPLWLTLEMNGEESEKQYVSASSYSMYSGLVDLNAFAPSDDVSFSLAPDGRIIIDLVNPYPTPIPDPNPILNTIRFGLKSTDPENIAVDLYHYLTINNRNGSAIGAFSHNLLSNQYKVGDDFEDFVVSAKDGRDLVLMSESGTYGTSREVSIGTLNSPNNLRVTGDLSVTGKLTTSLISDRNFYTGGSNNWLFHTPDDGRQKMYITNSIYSSASDWTKQTIFHETGDVEVNGDIIGKKDIKLRGKLYNDYDLVLQSNNTTGVTSNVFIGSDGNINDLRVTGTIFATEIQVKLNVFPDYVFKKDYNLLPLSEVESHINNYGTLPGMPTEKEIVENGLNINQMQIKLVEKIEELTLHMIRLEKENKELKDRLNTIIE